MHTQNENNGTVVSTIPSTAAPAALPLPLSAEQEKQFRAAVRQEAASVMAAAVTEHIDSFPLFTGTTKRRMQLGAIALGGVAVGVGGTLLVQKYRNRKVTK
jgi:hypothetical protein